MPSPHVQLVIDRDPPQQIPAPLHTALNRLNARVSIRSFSKALASGVSPTADVCVLLPSRNEEPDVLERILAEASQQACGALVIPGTDVDEDEALHGGGATAVMTRRLTRADAACGSMTADEITGRLRALCDVRAPLQAMREELTRLRERDRELTCGARERDEQLRLAGQIQLDLIQHRVEGCPLDVSTLFLPADHVSGDIYDVSRLDEERFGFSIADATGHGMPAALLTILIKHALRGKEIVNGNYRIIEPDELLARLNDELLTSNLSGCQFITGLHAIYDRCTHEIRWARAGAPYPILLRAGSPPRQLRSSGGLLGAFEAQTYEVARETLQPGDTLLLYTDGLEGLLLGRTPAGGDAAILDSEWIETLRTDGPDAAFGRIRSLAAHRRNRAWPHDDVTAIALSMHA